MFVDKKFDVCNIPNVWSIHLHLQLDISLSAGILVQLFSCFIGEKKITYL